MSTDRAWLHRADMKRLSDWADASGRADVWRALTSTLEEQALRDLLRMLDRLQPPERIHELRTLEETQDRLGAGFYGSLPAQVQRRVPEPADDAGVIDAAGALAEIRRSNLEAVRGAFHNYAWSFSGSTVAWPETPAMPGDWQLLVRVEGVATLLEALKRPDVTREEAQAVACLPAFTEMMTHRRDLGYVPEPLITADGLAWCIQHAASDDPLDALWRWLHPHNFFDLSDLRAHLSGYEQLVKDVDAHKSELASAVLGRIAAFVAPDFSFHDELTFAVGWGIRGWATRKTGGINLEHFKDDTESLLKTLTHETFHRLQVHLCPADASSTADGFERIIRRPLGDARDEALFRALAYLMLEGSATYVAAPRLDASWRASADSALDLLVRIRNLSAEDVEQQLDALLNEGLKSNGPFYGFGALLSDAIVRSDGNLGLGHALRQGAPAFAYRGLTILAEKGLTVPAGLLESVADLAKRVAWAMAGGKAEPTRAILLV